MRLRSGSVRQWHWISSAIGLTGLLFFAVTGVTLNHSGQLESPADTQNAEWQLPAPLLEQLKAQPEDADTLPIEVQHWLGQILDLPVQVLEQATDYSLELELSPRTQMSIQIDLETGQVFSETTTQGWVSFFNDLHTNRHGSLAWSWFIDFFAASCIIFSLSGLLLLKRQASGRTTTWPLVGLGLVIPVVLTVFFLH